MVETSDEPSLLDRIRSRAHVLRLGLQRKEPAHILPLTVIHPPQDATTKHPGFPASGDAVQDSSRTSDNNVADDPLRVLPPPAPPPASEESHGETSSAIDRGPKPNIAVRFLTTAKQILFSSIFNLLLIFVPVGIAVEYAHVSPTIVFAMNAIAIVPLAGLLSYATENVASRHGDTIGALLNVTFGNAVELIIL